MKVTTAEIVAVQDKRMVVDWFLLLKASPYFAVPLIRAGFSANAVTVLWGVINLAGAFLIYLTMIGHFMVLPLVVLAFVVSEILDTSDGEIARFTGTSNPVGGKMLDGVAHKATEYTLTAAYACATAVLTQSPLAVPIGLALMAGEAMGSYCYERRLLIIRIHIQSKEKIGGERPAGHTYVKRTAWWGLSGRHKLRTIAGLFSYKFAYAAIALAWFAPVALLWTLAALAAYKHVSWCRTVMQTLRLAERAASA